MSYIDFIHWEIAKKQEKKDALYALYLKAFIGLREYHEQLAKL